MGTIFCENLIAVSFILMEILTRQFRHEFAGLVARHENVGYERLSARVCVCGCVSTSACANLTKYKVMSENMDLMHGLI